MDNNEKQILAIDEQSAIGRALVLMVQQSPMIGSNKVLFEDMADRTVGVFRKQGAVYLKRYVSGMFVAEYPFFIRYRARPRDDEAKITAGEMLEKLSIWLEGGTVTVAGTKYRLATYPELTDKRAIEKIERQSDVFIAEMGDDGHIDYQVQMILRYNKR